MNDLRERLDKIIFPNGGRYLWGALAGPANATKRQAIMAALGQKLPKSKCGYFMVIEALKAALASDTTGCPADQDAKLIDRLKNGAIEPAISSARFARTENE